MQITTDFSTLCCIKPESGKFPGWLLACLLSLFFAPSLHAAEGASVKFAEIHATREGYELDAQFVLNPNRTLEDALQKGIALYFVAEAEITSPRNWWLDENIGEATRRMRIYYNLLLRRYVVDAGYVTKTAITLEEALPILGRLESWQVLERGALKPGQRYEARVRLRLDTSKLPKPLQIGVVTGGKWELESPWYDWAFDAPTPPARPSMPSP